MTAMRRYLQLSLRGHHPSLVHVLVLQVPLPLLLQALLNPPVHQQPSEKFLPPVFEKMYVFIKKNRNHSSAKKEPMNEIKNKNKCFVPYVILLYEVKFIFSPQFVVPLQLTYCSMSR